MQYGLTLFWRFRKRHVYWLVGCVTFCLPLLASAQSDKICSAALSAPTGTFSFGAQSKSLKNTLLSQMYGENFNAITKELRHNTITSTDWAIKRFKSDGFAWERFFQTSKLHKFEDFQQSYLHLKVLDAWWQNWIDTFSTDSLTKLGTSEYPLAVVNRSGESEVYAVTINPETVSYFRPFVHWQNRQWHNPSSWNGWIVNMVQEGLGLDVTPSNVQFGILNGQNIGSFSSDVKGPSLSHYTGPVDVASVNDLYAFYFLLEIGDNHAENFKIGDDGKIRGFDFESVLYAATDSWSRSAAGNSNEDLGSSIILPYQYSAKFVAALRKLTPELMWQKWSDQMPEEMLAVLMLRREIILHDVEARGKAAIQEEAPAFQSLIKKVFNFFSSLINH